MIPTFSRSWLRKITAQFDLEIAAVSLRSAWDMRRAWRPMCESPISPSISAFGTRAATESMTITSTALERTSTSTISSACSPVSGWLIKIYGPESAGKTTLALHVIAEAQKAGGVAAFVDAEHALDPLYASRIG